MAVWIGVKDAMRCPACLNQLSEIQVGNVAVDVCQGGCGGIWFDAFELQRVDEQHEAAGEHLLQIQRQENLNLDPTRKRECPRCADIKLKRHFFSEKRSFEVDECPNCGGYWLDAGELGKIREEKSQVANKETIRQSVVSPETIRYLYRLSIERRNQA